MIGDERVRFCGQCSLSVYNLSSMTRADAESLIARTEGRLCVRFYRRRDGSIITKDCPVGLRAIRRRVSYAAKAIGSMVLGLFAGLGVHGVFTSSAPLVSMRTMGIMAVTADPSHEITGQPIPQGRRTATLGEMEGKPTRHRAASTQKAGATPRVR